MRVASLAVRALLVGALATGLTAAAQAPAAADDDLTVTADGVTFDGKEVDDRDRDRDRDVGYSVRSLEGWDYAWLTEPLRGASGYVPFTGAAAEMPDGYCVTYVHVPDVGEWHESRRDTRCTEPATAEPAPAPNAEDTSPSPSPTTTTEPSEPKPEAEKPEPTPSTAEPSSTASAEPTPSPTPTPGPTPSASPTTSPTPSPSPSPSVAAVAEAMRTEQFEALGRSFSGDLPVIDDRHDTAAQDDVTDGELWAATGLGLAAVGLTAGGVVVWRMRRGED
ncbi:hypothetical protein UQW22_02160 [Isoptericola halotolerans]|uniref:hypothetical protein n=1 Tax=Isoptericola halotolerans TaxID=300560 RepID=UPI00388EC5FE